MYRYTPGMQAVKAHCRECQGETNRLAHDCTAVDCFLWPIRLGKRATEADIHKHEQARQEIIERNIAKGYQ